jgi:surface protein
MGRVLIIPGADFSANKLQIIDLVTKNNVPFYVYYGQNVVDSGGDIITGIEGVKVVNGSIYPNELADLGMLVFTASSYINSSNVSTPIHLYNADQSVDYGVSYPNNPDTLIKISFADMDVSNMVRFLSANQSLEMADLSSINANDADSFLNFCIFNKSLVSFKMPKRNVSSAISLRSLFRGCEKLESLDLSNFDGSGATDISQIFRDCVKLTTLNLNGWDMSAVTNAINAFYNCSNLVSVNMTGWNMTNIKNISQVFQNCTSLTSLDLSSWGVSNATTVQSLFEGCSSLTSLNIDGWDFSNVTAYNDWMKNCNALTTITGSIFNLGKSASSINVSNTNLTHDSLMVLINGLYDRTGLSQGTLKVNATELALLSTSEIAVATNKNWNITT